MSSNYLTTPKFRACSSTTGLPLVGYYLYTYAPATTTPKSTYPTVADMLALTNANANPVVLDSNGEAVIVLKGTTKLVLKDTSGSTIWTQDNVEANTVQLDANGAVLLSYSATSSAVNYLTLANSATGNGPTFSATGSDTNIDINMTPKGSGSVVLPKASIAALTLSGDVVISGTTLIPSSLAMYEQTTNGSNYIKFTTPAALSANSSYTLPTAVPAVNGGLLQATTAGVLSWGPSSSGSSGQHLTTDGSGTLSWSSANIPNASQSDQETSTSDAVSVTPAVQQYHPSAAKAWVHCGFSGDIVASYNVTSVTDAGTGLATFNIATDFSSSNYSAVINVLSTATPTVQHHGLQLKAAGSIQGWNYYAGGAADPTSGWYFVAFGDQ